MRCNRSGLVCMESTLGVRQKLGDVRLSIHYSSIVNTNKLDIGHSIPTLKKVFSVGAFSQKYATSVRNMHDMY